MFVGLAIAHQPYIFLRVITQGSQKRFWYNCHQRKTLPCSPIFAGRSMSDKSRKAGGDIFIVDNSDEYWKIAQYLQEWTQIAHSFDIATGYFEIGALLMLDGMWQKLDKIRILMGDEVSKRTKQAFEDALHLITIKLDDSLEDAKEEDDFLHGVPAIVSAIRNGQIETRVYRKKKFR